ncbi:uncharacterized protein TRAVEDRAFT_26444 [Trametes versicolor FP-101664 SS1]|uniref:uncharacterized protein n=1 Tax=Trametes versicolor (strain FP-101664) TaxID=717944 RepID=UPI00046236E1|nr:uncharacterized protein TRAVEDRAFT_26444 [Trametes versicolor FP-101664 SS1]EIW62941.1 hypothetical protein TRAVEDRAFT_26444 [Trametes versicolor FP-101664 SS1]
MAISVALWSITATPGEPSVISPPSDIRITNIALGEEITDENSRTTIKLVYRRPGSDEPDSEDEEDDEEEENDNSELSTTVLCSLTPGKIEQATVDVVLTEDEEYLIEVVGKNTVYLTGNYIDQNPFDQDPYGDEDDSEEEDFDLQDVSSDVEINPDELEIPSSDDEGRFEEIDDAAAAKSAADSKKRPRDSDAMETDEKLSKSQQKKQKKLKAASGEAVPAATPEKKDEKKKEKKEKAEKEKPKAETKTVAGGVKLVDNKTGTGPQAKTGDMVSMRYIGKLENGKIFDQNTKGKPFKFRLGKGEVIKGWDVGIVGMQVGGERLLTIPAPMAYGKKAQSGIPANSTLIFEVKLLSIN